MDDTNHALFPRFSAELVATALKDTPVVMVTGPRQCGKTTLVRNLVAGNREFLTMDDDTVLAAARSDPTGLVRALDRTTIDEVQRVPDLLRAIKKSVDDDRRAGRFLLTGSANILTLPQQGLPPAVLANRWHAIRGLAPSAHSLVSRYRPNPECEKRDQREAVAARPWHWRL